jgi:hypothetical protein
MRKHFKTSCVCSCNAHSTDESYKRTHRYYLESLKRNHEEHEEELKAIRESITVTVKHYTQVKVWGKWITVTESEITKYIDLGFELR